MFKYQFVRRVAGESERQGKNEFPLSDEAV